MLSVNHPQKFPRPSRCFGIVRLLFWNCERRTGLANFPSLALVNHGLLIIPIYLIGSISLSSPPVAGVWWAHWRRCPVAAVASSKWMLHISGGWGETPPHDCKALWVYSNTQQKVLYKCIIHSFIIVSMLQKRKICENGNLMHMRTYNVTLPTTVLAYIIKVS